MSLERQSWAVRLFFAVGILIRGVRCDNELIANLEFSIGELARGPDSETGRVTEPVLVLLGNIANVVELFGRVVDMDIRLLAVDRALELIATVFHSPQTTTISWRLL